MATDLRTVHARPAMEEDLPMVLQMYAQHDYDDGEVLSLEEAKAVLAKIETYPNYHIYVAEMEDKPVGSFALMVMDNIGHSGEPSAVLAQVVVKSSEQGKGIGGAMIFEAIRLAREAGCYKLSLSISAKRTDALAYMERLGFERRGFSYVVDL